MSEKDIIVLCGVLIIFVIVVIIASKLGARDGRLKAKDVIIEHYEGELKDNAEQFIKLEKEAERRNKAMIEIQKANIELNKWVNGEECTLIKLENEVTNGPNNSNSDNIPVLDSVVSSDRVKEVKKDG